VLGVQAWSSRTWQCRPTRTLTRRSWCCRCVRTRGPRGVVRRVAGGARVMTRRGGRGDGGRWTPGPLGRSCRRRRRRCSAPSMATGGACSVGAAGREVHVPVGGHPARGWSRHDAECGGGVPAVCPGRPSRASWRGWWPTGPVRPISSAGSPGSGSTRSTLISSVRAPVFDVRGRTRHLAPVWAHEGRNKDTLTKFFRALGESRSALMTHVSADGAEWMDEVTRW